MGDPMFSFVFPRELELTIKFAQLHEDIVSWNDIREIVRDVTYLVNGTLQVDGNVFKIQSSNLDRLMGFARGMVALYDVFHEFINNYVVTPNVDSVKLAKTPPIIIAQMQSNLFRPRNILINFLNEVIKTLDFQIYIEIIDAGAIIFVQDRPSYDFIARGLNPPFIDAIIADENLLQGSDRRSLAQELLNHLQISSKIQPKS